MKERISYIFRVFLFFIASFVFQKLLFLFYNRDAAVVSDMDWTDWIGVVAHGLSLDVTTATYLTLLPLVLVVASLFCNVRIRRVAIPYYICVSLTVSLIFIADVVIYTYWGFKLNSAALLYIDNPGAVAANVSVPFLIVCFCAVLSLAVFLTSGLYVLTPERFSVLRHSGRMWSVVLIPVALMMFLFMRGGTDESTSNISRAYYSSRQFLNHAAVNPVFNVFYSLSKLVDFDNEFHIYNEEERERLISGVFTTESVETESVLNTQRPNILLVIWEGCGGHFVEFTGGDKDVTPCLNAMVRDGLAFTNCYAGSFRTDRGTVCLLNGWLCFPTISIMKMTEKSRTLPSLASSLSGEGYRTDFWYGGDIDFTNMRSYLYESGYERLFSDAYFPQMHRTYSRWGVPDHIVLDSLAVDILRRKDDEKWFTTALTLSSHEPWTVPYKRLEDKKKNSFAYTDNSLGKFIDRLKASSVWDSLLVVIVPDHGIKKHGGQSGSDYRIAHIPMIWTGGAVAGRRVEDVLMSQADLAATLLGQLHIPHDRFLFSRDVFSATYTYPSAFHTFSNGMTFIDSTGVSTFDNDIQGVTLSENTGAECADSIRTRRARAILQTLCDDMAER